MPEYLQSLKLNKILTELRYLQFLRSIIQQHLTLQQHTALTISSLRIKVPNFRAWKAGQIQSKTPLSVSYKCILVPEVARPHKFAL